MFAKKSWQSFFHHGSDCIEDQLETGVEVGFRVKSAFGNERRDAFPVGIAVLRSRSSSLAAQDPVKGDGLRMFLSAITLCVDSSDRLLGCLWIGLVSVAALRVRAFPRSLALLGIAIGLPAIIGMASLSCMAKPRDKSSPRL